MNFFERSFPLTQKFVHYEYLNLKFKNKIHFIFIEYKLIHSTNLHSKFTFNKKEDLIFFHIKLFIPLCKFS